MIRSLVFPLLLQATTLPDSTLQQRCSSCHVYLTRTVVMGASRDSGGRFGDTQSVRVGALGEFYVLKPLNPERLFVYSNVGAFRRSLRFDSVGSGNAGAVSVIGADTAMVFNNARGQIIGVSVAGRAAARSGYPGSVHRAAALPDGRWLVNGEFRTSNLIGLPLHILSGTGVTASFGSATREYRPDRPLEGWRHIAPWGVDSVYSIRWTEPTLEVWSLSGTLLRTVPLELPEFVPWREGQRWSLTSAPPSLIDDVWVESPDRIWLLVSVGARTWRTAMEVAPTPDGQLALPRDWTEALSSWIVVIDGASGTLRFAARFTEYLRQFLPGGRVLGIRGAPNGEGSLSVFAIAGMSSLQKGF